MLLVQPILSHCDGLMDLCVLPASNSKNRGNTPEDAWFVHSAKTLERTMDISSHVAWHMRHRFRVAMVRASREQLSGEFECVLFPMRLPRVLERLFVKRLRQKVCDVVESEKRHLS